MQIVIDIPDFIYTEIRNITENTGIIGHNAKVLYNAIYHGTPLPKGHGRLIDADALPLNAIDDANHGSNYIRIAPTIIEADRGEWEQMNNFKIGEYIIYVNGERYELGRIKKLTENGAFVCYHEGETAAKTPYDLMHKLINGFTIKTTTIGGETFKEGEW